MLKKLCLDQTKIYEKHLALEEISKMLVYFVNGQSHHLAIGAEQGEYDKWDDLVIEKNGGGNIYIQAKRQLTDFSNDLAKRDTNREGELKKLSPLDKSLESLGKIISLENLQNEFWLEVPGDLIEIKKELEIRHLRKFCEDQIKSVTMPSDLISLASIDKNVETIYLWLTTWCGFVDWNHILKALRILRIRTSGMESDINTRVFNNFRQIFKSTEIEKVRMLILSYLDDNITFAGAIRPRQLLFILKDCLLPSIARWTLFQTDSSSWSISGIHDLEDNNEIERPSVIVPALWATGNPNARSLKIDGACVENCLISESLMRLSLHAQSSFDIYCSEKPSWLYSIKNKIGGTLGISRNDLNDLRILDGSGTYTVSEAKNFTTTDEREELAENLHNEMYRTNFKFINKAILDKVSDIKKGLLRTEIESRWMTWKLSLENSVEEQKKLFSSILHPKAEGLSISGELRVGPKTVDLLSEALLHLLVISVCLGDLNNQSWGSVTDKLKMNSLGLAFWSGPAEGSKKKIEIDDDTGICKLLENEPGQILIISQSELSETDLFNDDISGEITKLGLLTHPRYPKMLITRERKFYKELLNGDITALRKYFQTKLEKYDNAIESAIEKVVDEVVQ